MINEERAFQQRMQSIEGLIYQIEKAPDAALKKDALELVHALLELHGTGLDRILEIVAQAGETGLGIIDELGRDELTASLLLLYNLHPADFETRVQQALAQVRPYLHSHGGSIELLSVAGGVVRLRLQGSCNGCASSAATITQTVEQALYAAAPDLQALEIEGAATPRAKPATANGLVRLERRA